MWLCKIFGHKHKLSGGGWAQLVPHYCLRCHANNATPKGDGALICKLVGHRTHITLHGSFVSHRYSSTACMRCHAGEV